jgi:ABC-type polar amino acid transport system ATPase subunit
VEGTDLIMSATLDVSALELQRGTRAVLRGVSFNAAPGEIVALMGLSGCGKTTILRAVAGLETFHAGSIRVGDVTLSPGSQAPGADSPLRRAVGFVFQFHHLFEHLSAIENVRLAPVHVHGVSQDDADRRGRTWLDDLGVGHRAGALPRELSGGEAQRVALARALALDPSLLLLDEPTASLDPARRTDLGETLQRLAANGRTLVVTCHDDDFVRDFADTVVILADGVVVECGPARQILTSPTHAATRALLQG